MFLLIFLLSNVSSEPLNWIKHDFTGSPKPPARKFGAMGYDQSRDFLAIFGGLGAENALNDTWVLDKSAQRWYYVPATETTPSARYGMVYGVSDGILYIFGGQNLTLYFNEVWGFYMSSFQWKKLNFSGHLLPSARSNSAGGVFPSGTVLIDSQGWDGSFVGDTFMLDLPAKRWFQLETRQISYSPISPHSRTKHSSTMISPSKLLIFGGCAKHGPCPAADAWVFDTETRQWQQLDACPPASRNGILVYLKVGSESYALLMGGDTKGRQIFGGQMTNDLKDIYVLNINTFDWTIKTTAIQSNSKIPQNRIGSSLASTTQGFAMIFGGESFDGKLLDDLWEIGGDPIESKDSAKQCQTSHFTLISLHGVFMFLGLGLCSIFGAAVAYYGTGVRDETRLSWKYIHIVAQVSGAILTFMGIICGLVLIPEGISHFSSVHGCLGLIVFLLLLIQGLLIPLSRYFEDYYEEILKIHFWHGLAVIFLSIINSSLGLFLAMTSSGLWISYFVYILIVAIVFFVLQAVNIFRDKQTN